MKHAAEGCPAFQTAGWGKGLGGEPSPDLLAEPQALSSLPHQEKPCTQPLRIIQRGIASPSTGCHDLTVLCRYEQLRNDARSRCKSSRRGLGIGGRGRRA